VPAPERDGRIQLLRGVVRIDEDHVLINWQCRGECVSNRPNLEGLALHQFTFPWVTGALANIHIGNEVVLQDWKPFA
jgi:hypothetical protein